ncbi:hypothetical protein GCM10011329_19030 [Stakelama pacifica]|nr:hypothetical protein GCM10011329_19030 [Stakelama pacifica]
MGEGRNLHGEDERRAREQARACPVQDNRHFDIPYKAWFAKGNDPRAALPGAAAKRFMLQRDNEFAANRRQKYLSKMN